MWSTAWWECKSTLFYSERILSHDMGIFLMGVEGALIAKSKISFLLKFCFGRVGEVPQCISCTAEWTWAASTIAELTKGWGERHRLRTAHVWTRNIALVLMSWYAPHNLTPAGQWVIFAGVEMVSSTKEFVLKPPLLWWFLSLCSLFTLPGWVF